jgi:hypothetical protein
VSLTVLKRSIFVGSSLIYINTWRTAHEQWSVAVEVSDGEATGLMACEDSVRFLSEVKESILKLPVRVALPRYYSDLSLPRYYVVFTDCAKIIDIVGVHRDLSPTKWSYRLGYWHPRCQLDVVKAIDMEIREVMAHDS